MTTSPIAPTPRPFHRTLEIRIPVARAWSGLIERATLTRWLCDTLELEPQAGGIFRPGGAHCVTVQPADGRVVTLEPHHRLELAWPIGGVETRLTFELEPEGDHTRLTFEHVATGSWPAGLDVPAVWALNLTNLRTALEQSGPVPLRMDFTCERTGLIWIGLSIHALPARVYQLLTDAHALSSWLSTPARIDLREGGQMTFGWRERGPTTVLGLKKNRLLVHGWQDAALEAPTRVTWSIMPEERGSRLEFLHEGFKEGEDSLGHRLLWTAALLLLKDRAEHDRSVGIAWEDLAST
jgi:uncharacterized protein YndB with AHSA1/START domain